MSLALRLLGTGRLAKHGRVLTEEDGDPIEAGADPDQLARGAQLVELLRPVAGHSARKHVALPELDRERQALSGTSASRRVARRSTPCQLGRKRPRVACSAGSTSRRSAASDARRSRRSTSTSHHSRSVPPGRNSPRTSLSSRSSTLSSSSARDSSIAKRVGDLAGGERPARAGESCEERAECVLDRLQECVGKPARRHHAQGVAVPARVLHRGEPLLAADAERDRPPLAQELIRPLRVVLIGAQVACAAQNVVQLVRSCEGCLAAAPRPPRARPGRSGRGALPAPAAPSAGRGRATEPERAAPRAGCRPRTCSWPRSRRGARSSTERPRPFRRRPGRAARVFSPVSSRFSAGRSKTSCRHSR